MTQGRVQQCHRAHRHGGLTQRRDGLTPDRLTADETTVHVGVLGLEIDDPPALGFSAPIHAGPPFDIVAEEIGIAVVVHELRGKVSPPKQLFPVSPG